MIYRISFIIVALVLLRYVYADWDGNPEGDTGSGIQTVDTDEGFNVTDSGGMLALAGKPLLDLHARILLSSSTKCV